jgi:hypothetical protein
MVRQIALNFNCDYVTAWYVPSVSHVACTVYVGVRVNLSASEYLLP